MNKPIHTDRKCQENAFNPEMSERHATATESSVLIGGHPQPDARTSSCPDRESPAGNARQRPEECISPQCNTDMLQTQIAAFPSDQAREEFYAAALAARSQYRQSVRIARLSKYTSQLKKNAKEPQERPCIRFLKVRIAVPSIFERTCWRNAITAFRFSLHRFLGRFRS